MARLLAGLLAIITISAATAWLLRDRLAEHLIARWCEARDLGCDIAVEQISLTSVDLSQLAIRANGATPVEASRVTAAFTWPEWLKPQLTTVSVSQPVIRLRYDGRHLDAYGLESLSGQGGEQGVDWPVVEITDGRAELETPAGTLVAAFSASGHSPDNLDASIRVEPAQLKSGAGEITWSRGEFDLQLVDGLASGEARLEMSQGRLESVSVRNARFDARLRPYAEGGAISFDWTGELEEAVSGSQSLAGLRTQGRLSMKRLELGSLSKFVSALDSAMVTLKAAAIDTGPISGRSARFDAEFERAQGRLAGPTALEVSQIRFAGHRADRLALTGDAMSGPGGDMTMEGRLVLEGAALNPAQRTTLAEMFAVNGIAAAHGRQLGDELDAALAKFDTGSDFRFTRASEGNWSLTGTGPVQFQAASGLGARIEPFANRPWLQANEQEVGVSGDFRLKAKRTGLDLSGQLAQLQSGTDKLEIIARDLQLRRYEADALALTFDLGALAYENASGILRASAEGTVTIDGRLTGATLRATSVFGGIDAFRGVEGWRIQTRGARCIGFDSAGATFQSVGIGSFDLALCPEDGRFLQERGGHPEGVVTLEAIKLPFTTGRTSGTIGLEDARLGWVLRNGLATQLRGDTLTIAIDTGSEDLVIDARRPNLEASAGPSPLRISGALSEISFSGSLVPARVSAASGEFVLNDRHDGPAGQALLDTVRISDPRPDPVFEPLLASAEARVQSGTLTIDAPVRLADTGLLVGRGKLQLGFPRIDGFGSFITEPLRFGPGRLQPHDLSDRLRGFFTDARGEAAAAADILIRDGRVSGSGWAELDEFGFQTLSFSRVSGVDGRVVFDSLFPLSTPPGQGFSVDEIDPGISLRNGVVRFQLVEGREARLESAIWPFAGGTLSVAPGAWRVAGGRNTVTVEAERISLQALSEELSVPGLYAEGTVSGRFPVEFSGGSAFIRNAKLVADSDGGRLSYTGRVADQASSTNENVALAFQALENFEFEVLEIGADGDVAGDITVTARLLGQNADVLGGSAFDFNVSIDSQLAQLLSTSRQWTGTDWLAEIEARRAEGNPPDGG